MQVGHVHKRFVSSVAKVASVSTVHLPSFPPKEASYVRREFPKSPLEPDVWASLQPPPPSAFSAFIHRIGLGSVITDTDLIQQACTHPSFLSLWQRHNSNASLPLSNAISPPSAAVTAHVGPLTCSSVAQEMGAVPLLRWHRAPPSTSRPSVLYSDALASIPRSITALVYQKRSLLSARQFVHAYFMSRQVDLRAMLNSLEMIKKFGREWPKSRLLKETGRFTNSPVFVVGIYSGADELGQGFGSSLKMAEYRAAEDALQRVFLTRTPDHELNLPTSTFAPGLGDIFSAKEDSGSYTAPELVMGELMSESSGKSHISVPASAIKEMEEEMEEMVVVEAEHVKYS
ncbi:hypothetical protein BDQ17DRAFT_1389529 [Cyathus striatus]|nr:hypothetical protein BDQ17DRAFT_1389529 [Cyathus striatus]